MTTCSFIRAADARKLARNLTLLYTEICAIQSAVLAAIEEGKYSTVINNNTPFTMINNIESVVVTAGGSDYEPVEATATVTSASGGGAMLVPIVTGQSITGFSIQDGGSGYLETDTNLVVEHPTGFGFVGQLIIVGGTIFGVDIEEGGNLYQPLLPTATIVSSSGVGAELSVEVDDGEITGITVTDGGYGYSEDATVVITPAPTSTGSGAEAEVTVNFSEDGLTSSVYYEVISGQSSDKVIKDQLQFIQDYFTSLDYNIRPQVNPSTGENIQWLVSW